MVKIGGSIGGKRCTVATGSAPLLGSGGRCKPSNGVRGGAREVSTFLTENNSK